jgi:hypothetical protein
MLLLLRLRSGLLLGAVEMLIEDAVLLLLGQTRLLPRSLAEVHDGLLWLFFLRVWLVLVECLLCLFLELPGARLDDWHLLAGSRLFLIEIVEKSQTFPEILAGDEVVIEDGVSSCKFILH